MTVTPPETQVDVFPVLDTMRALAATAVLVTHVAFQTGQYSEGLWGTALARLDIGVAVFFVLSGFLLTRPYLLAARKSRPAPSLRRYLRRRSLRIMPVYVVTVCAALLLLPDNRGASAGEWIRNLTLTDIYAEGSLPAGLSQMWSLSAEVAFYVLLPVVMLSVRVERFRSSEVRWAATAGLVALMLSIAWIIFALGDTALPPSALQWLPSYAIWFAAGMVLAAVQVHVSSSGRPHPAALTVARLGRLPGSCLMVSLGLFLIACTPLAGPVLLYLPTAQQAVVKTLLYAAIAGTLILPGVFALSSGTFNRVMSWPPLRHLGHISYSVFCIHLIVLALVVEALDMELFTGQGLLVFGLTLTFTVIASELLYWGVERPFMRLGRGPRSRRATPRSSASVKTTSS
ncbi:MAG TPA: acyltransferase [Nocardioidaceae bacterium]|nr:acyltransferase [Nocardioidaceae bacterium]